MSSGKIKGPSFVFYSGDRYGYKGIKLLSFLDKVPLCHYDGQLSLNFQKIILTFRMYKNDQSGL